jgi:electron transfer flavoprotein beta subunit
VLSIKTGINEPSYVWKRGIRQAASMPIRTVGATDLDVDAATVGEGAARVNRVDYFTPATGDGAAMLDGSREQIVDALVELLKAKGGLA